MKTRTRILAAVVLLAFGLLATGGWFWHAAYGDRSEPTNERHVVIAQGLSFAQVAEQLAAAGVIDDVGSFRLLGRVTGRENEVRAGEYRFAPHQTEENVLQALLSGGAQVAVWTTIPEGYTSAQIAKRLDDAGVGAQGMFERNFSTSTIVIAGTRTKSLEGFLFPSTYLVPIGATPAAVSKQMTGEFARQLPSDAASQSRRLGVTVPQAVTVASLVEREAKVDGDRPMIAGVIYNRLRLKMPLEIDATIEYALPEHKSALSYADLKVDSPFNTYVRTGLPPTPIANPGRPSLEASLHPSKTDFLYYVYCGNGRHVFAKTLEEHQINVNRCLR